MFLWAVGLWFVFLFVIAGLGAARDFLLAPRIGSLRAHQVGTVAACAAVGVIAVWFTRSQALTTAEAWQVGGLWLGMGFVFEFGFFHYVANKPWSELLHDYNLAAGRLLILLWLTVLLTPVLTVVWTG